MTIPHDAFKTNQQTNKPFSLRLNGETNMLSPFPLGTAPLLNPKGGTDGRNSAFPPPCSTPKNRITWSHDRPPVSLRHRPKSQSAILTGTMTPNRREQYERRSFISSASNLLNRDDVKSAHSNSTFSKIRPLEQQQFPSNSLLTQERGETNSTPCIKLTFQNTNFNADINRDETHPSINNMKEITSINRNDTQIPPDMPPAVLRLAILEHAHSLGMDIQRDAPLFWIAKQSLLAPVPTPWLQLVTEEGQIYFWNRTTKESRWDHPCDEEFRNLFLRERKRLDLKKGVARVKVDDVEMDGYSCVHKCRADCNPNSLRSRAADEMKEWNEILANMKSFLVRNFKNSNIVMRDGDQPGILTKFLRLVEEVKDIFSSFAKEHFANLDCTSLVLEDDSGSIPDVSSLRGKNLEIE